MSDNQSGYFVGLIAISWVYKSAKILALTNAQQWPYPWSMWSSCGLGSAGDGNKHDRDSTDLPPCWLVNVHLFLPD